MSPDCTALLDAVREGLAAATRVTRRLQGQVEAIQKADGSPVTIADLSSQALILRALMAVAPDAIVVAEESFPTGEADRIAAILAAVREEVPTATADDLARWIDFGKPADGAEPPFDRPHWLLDPIDGTKGFLAGEQFAIALARVEGDWPTLAAMACPNLGPDRTPLVCFADTERAWRETADGELPLRVSDVSDPAEARTLESRAKGHSDRGQQGRIYDRLGIVRDPVRMDGMGKYALVAMGQGELYTRLPHPRQPNRRQCAWDHAAGMLIVEKAGGRVTGTGGETLDASGMYLSGSLGVLATNGALHDAALTAIADEARAS